MHQILQKERRTEVSTFKNSPEFVSDDFFEAKQSLLV
jgi:hypothetical protein